MTTHRPAAEAAEGTRPAGQAEDCGGHVCPEHMSKEPCIYCIAETSNDTAGHPGPPAGVEPPVVAVAGRKASEACSDCGRPQGNGEDNCAKGARFCDITDDYECDTLTLARLRSELSALRQQLEAERHGAWAAGHRAGWKDRFGSDCAFDQGYDPDEPTPNPYPPPPAEAPALPVGKETE